MVLIWCSLTSGIFIVTIIAVFLWTNYEKLWRKFMWYNYSYLDYTQYIWLCYHLMHKLIFGSHYLYIDSKSQFVHKYPINYCQPKQHNNIRFVCISDTHSFHQYIDIPNGDVLVHCGDILLSDSHKYIAPSVEKIHAFKQWLLKLPHKYKIIIAGNHDYSLEQLGKQHVNQLFCDGNNDSIIYLENEAFTLKYNKHKIKIYGSPFSIENSKESPNKAFQLNRTEIQKIWKLIPKDIDILITHHMPHQYRSGNRGCEQLTNTLHNCSKCKYHLFGHYHEKYGVMFGEREKFQNQWRENVCFVNASTLNGIFMCQNHPIVFDYHLSD